MTNKTTDASSLGGTRTFLLAREFMDTINRMNESDDGLTPTEIVGALEAVKIDILLQSLGVSYGASRKLN